DIPQMEQAKALSSVGSAMAMPGEPHSLEGVAPRPERAAARSRGGAASDATTDVGRFTFADSALDTLAPFRRPARLAELPKTSQADSRQEAYDPPRFSRPRPTRRRLAWQLSAVPEGGEGNRWEEGGRAARPARCSSWRRDGPPPISNAPGPFRCWRKRR